MNRPKWVGVVLAPLIAPIAYMVFVMVFIPDSTPKQERTWEAAAVVTALFLVPASYAVSLIFGAPLIYILGRLKKLSFWWVTTLALPLGAAALVCLLLVSIVFGVRVQWEGIHWKQVAFFLSSGAILGSMVAATFCLLAGITGYSTATPGSACK